MALKLFWLFGLVVVASWVAVEWRRVPDRTHRTISILTGLVSAGMTSWMVFMNPARPWPSVALLVWLFVVLPTFRIIKA